MNKIFKVIWSKSRNCYVVASELAKGTSKSTSTGRMAKRAALAAVAALLLFPAGIGNSYAALYNINSTTVKNTSGEEKSVITGTADDASKIAGAIMRSVNNASEITNLQHEVDSFTSKLNQHQDLINNLGTDKLTLSSDNTLQKESYDSTTKTTTKTDVTGLKVAGQVSAESGKITNSLEVGHNVNVGGAVNVGSLNSRGNLNVDGNALVKGTLTSQSTINGNEIVSQTNITAKNKVVGMQGVVDNTLTSGNYVTAGNTVGKNIVALDTQVKANADQFTTDKTSTALHVSKDGNLIVGTKENQTVKDLKIRGQLTSGSISTGDITSTGDVSVAGKVEAEAVYDDTTKTGNYVVQTHTVGANLGALDTQVKANADAINEEAQKRKYSVTNLEKADAAEAAAREAADAALNSRTTALEDKTEAITYDKDSKTVMVEGKLTATEGITDGTTQDSQYVKADNYVGQNLNALDQGLQAETSARVAAKLVEAVNSGLSLSNDNVLQKNTTTIDAQGNVTTSKTDANEMILNKGKDNQITLNENGIKVGTNSSVVDKDGVYTGGDTYSEAKAALKSDGSIKGADGKFTVNSANGTVSVNDQIELNGATGVVKSNGLNVGDGNFKVNSNGGVTAADGKITLNSDGSVKAANGNFTVNSNGGVTAADGKITLNSDGSVKAANGNFTVNSNGGVTAAEGKITLNSDGSVKAANGNFTVNSNGGVTAAEGKITLNSDGSVKAANGNFTVDTNGAVKAANGNTTIDSNGNLKTAGTLSAADGSFKVDSNGKITSTGLDAGNGTIQTTGTVQAGDVKTGTLETTGDATIGGNLTVDKNLTVNGEFNAKTLSSKLDENNYTTITGGKTQSVNLKMDTATGETKASASTFDETGSNMWAKDDDSIGKSTVTADGISQKLSDTGDNPKAYAESTMSQGTDNKYTMTDTVKDGDKTNVASQSATESSDVITDENKNTSTFRQKVDSILQEINNAAGDTLTKVEQTDTAITSQIGDGSAIKNVMNADGIANTAIGKSITNDAADITNTGTNSVTNQVGNNKVVVDTTGVKSAYGDNTYTTWNATGITNSTDGNMTTTVGGNETHTVGGTLTETVTGKATENYNGGLETTITGEEKHTVNGNQTNTVNGKQTTTVTGDSSLTAENINNTAKNKITNKALDVETDASSSIVNKVSNDAGSNTSTQLSYQTKEEMSQADGKTASYLRGAAEEKSQLTDGDKKTTIDTIAGQTNTNITEGTNTSNSLQKADQIASSVTDGTNTTVVNQDAKSLASSITDGTKANNTNNTVDKSEHLIKASDTQYSATTKTATKMEDALVSGSSVIDVIKSLDDAGSPLVSSAVTDGTNTTGITQTAKDITNTAKNGTIANDAKDIINNATENMTNTVGKDLTTTVGGEMKTTVTGKTTENYNGGLETTITGEEKHTVNGSQINAITRDQTNTIGGKQTTTVTGDSSLSAKNITNTASETLSNSAKNITNSATEKLSNSAAEIENTATKSITDKVGENTSWEMTDGTVVESVKDASGKTNQTTTTAADTYQSVQNGKNVLAKKTSSTNDNLNITDGTNTYSKITTATSNKQTVTDGTETASTNLTKSASNTYITNGTQTVTNHIAADTTNTVMNEGSNGSRQEQTVSQILNRVTDGTDTSEVTQTASGISTTAKTITNTASESITNTVGKTTVTTTDSGTTFENTDHNTAIKEGTVTKTTISGNTIETGRATMDYAEVMKDLGVHGNATVDQNLTVKGTTTTDKLVVNNGATIKGGTTTDTLHVTSTSTFDGETTFKDAVTMEKDLSVGGNATVAGSMTAYSYKVGNNTYIDSNGINANNQKIVNVAAGDLSANSTDAVNGAQLYQTNERVTDVENKVNKLDSRVDKVGANAAALANLHPLEFDADSKWNIAAAVGGYKGETATAIGAFYRPNENVMVNVSSSFGTGENMYGGGISLRIGQGGNKARRNATNGLTEREKAQQKQIDYLTSRLDALLSVINPNMSKDFPDVPENHWAYEAVSKLAGNGIIQGYEDGKYHGERTMTRYEMAEIIYNALSKGAKAEKKLVEEFKPELQAMAAQKKA